MLSTFFYIKINVLFKKKYLVGKCSYMPLLCNFVHTAAPPTEWKHLKDQTRSCFCSGNLLICERSSLSPSFIVPSIRIMFLGRATQAKILVPLLSQVFLMSVSYRKRLSNRCLRVHPRVHVVVTEEAWVG